MKLQRNKWSWNITQVLSQPGRVVRCPRPQKAFLKAAPCSEAWTRGTATPERRRRPGDTAIVLWCTTHDFCVWVLYKTQISDSIKKYNTNIDNHHHLPDGNMALRSFFLEPENGPLEEKIPNLEINSVQGCTPKKRCKKNLTEYLAFSTLTP